MFAGRDQRSNHYATPPTEVMSAFMLYLIYFCKIDFIHRSSFGN